MTPPYQPEIRVSPETYDGNQAADDNATSCVGGGAGTALCRQTFGGVFGVTWTWRTAIAPNNFWDEADREVDPASTYSDGPELYLELMQLFTGIQRAGPDLRPQSFQSGLAGFSRSFTTPYALEGTYAPGQWAFVNDMMAWWWNPNDAAPGNATGTGCFEEVGSGVRHNGASWPHADDSHGPGPCGADWLNSGQGSAAYYDP
jgi:hypothetical protein